MNININTFIIIQKYLLNKINLGIFLTMHAQYNKKEIKKLSKFTGKKIMTRLEDVMGRKTIKIKLTEYYITSENLPHHLEI